MERALRAGDTILWTPCTQAECPAEAPIATHSNELEKLASSFMIIVDKNHKVVAFYEEFQTVRQPSQYLRSNQTWKAEVR